MPLILVCPPGGEKKKKGVDLKLQVFTANLCQPALQEKNVVSFGKQRSLARLSHEELLRVTATLHNGTFLVTPATPLLSCLFFFFAKAGCQISHACPSLLDFTNQRKQKTHCIEERGGCSWRARR